MGSTSSSHKDRSNSLQHKNGSDSARYEDDTDSAHDKNDTNSAQEKDDSNSTEETDDSNSAQEKDGSNFPYKKIKIQKLKNVKYQHYDHYDAKQEWKKIKCRHYGENCNCNILTYLENIPGNANGYGNGFYRAFTLAYNYHGDIILSPDDVWAIICFEFSKYINNNPEKMRNKFVNFEGKQRLTVTTANELDESQWDEFFTSMIAQIHKNTKDNIVDTLAANFTTTGRVEQLISIATIMDSFKNYFDYCRGIPMCGINNVLFMGQLDDWTKLRSKMLALQKYAISDNDSWSKYITELIPIIDKFIETYNGNVDVDFWNKIMDKVNGRRGSGWTTYVSGWILKFFGIYHRIDAAHMPSYKFDVPVRIDNHLTGENKNVNIVGGFGGVNKTKIDGRICYRPQLSMIVYHDGN